MIQAKFCLNYPSGFRGEDFWTSLQTDDGRQVMAIAHTGELKTSLVRMVIWIPVTPRIFIWTCTKATHELGGLLILLNDFFNFDQFI